MRRLQPAGLIMGVRAKLDIPARRLLTHYEAASYCGVSASVFERTCPITPISLSTDGRHDRRLLRYDVRSLDEWIDLLSGRIQGTPERRDWASDYD